RTVSHSKGRPGLESRDARNLPFAEDVFQPAGPRSGNFPKIDDGQTLRTIEVARSTINLHPALHYRNRRQVRVTRFLHIDRANAVASAIDELRPRVRRRTLESPREPAVQTSL